MTALAAYLHDDRVSLLDMVERSLHLGSRTLEQRLIPVEIVESPGDATAEAYVTEVSVVGEAARIQLELDFGMSATATLPAFEAEWLELAEGQIIAVRLDRWPNAG
jgi:hypothetical protein